MNRRTFFNRLAMGVAGVMGLQVATVATGKRKITKEMAIEWLMMPPLPVFPRRVLTKQQVIEEYGLPQNFFDDFGRGKSVYGRAPLPQHMIEAKS